MQPTNHPESVGFEDLASGNHLLNGLCRMGQVNVGDSSFVGTQNEFSMSKFAAASRSDFHDRLVDFESWRY